MNIRSTTSWICAAALLATFAFNAPAFAQDAPPAENTVVVGGASTKATLIAEKSTGEIGERIPVRVVLSTEEIPSKITLSLPKEQATIAVFEEVVYDGKEFRTALRPLKDGENILGPIDVTITHQDGTEEKLEGGPISLTIASPIVPEGTPREYTPPAEIPFNWAWRNATVALIAVVVALILFLIIRWLSKRKRTEELPVAPPLLPAVEEARLALRNLAAMAIFRNDGAESHYTTLSMLMRRYLEREYHITALEMTDDEIVRFLRERLSAREGAATLPELFTRSSAAKFARAPLTEEVAQADCASADKFLEAESVRIERERIAAIAAAQAKAAAKATNSAPPSGKSGAAAA
jgi:hypothetical protein